MKYTLVGVDGNAYVVMGYVKDAMREVGMNQGEREAYVADATSGDYNHLLRTSMDMLDKCNERLENDEE